MATLADIAPQTELCPSNRPATRRTRNWKWRAETATQTMGSKIWNATVLGSRTDSGRQSCLSPPLVGREIRAHPPSKGLLFMAAFRAGVFHPTMARLPCHAIGRTALTTFHVQPGLAPRDGQVPCHRLSYQTFGLLAHGFLRHRRRSRFPHHQFPLSQEAVSSAANPKFAPQLLRVRLRTSGSRRH